MTKQSTTTENHRRRFTKMALTQAHNRSLMFRLLGVALTFITALLIHQPWHTSSIITMGVVEALPNGAAGCEGGIAAAMGFHLNYSPDSTSKRVGDTGEVAEFNTTLFINTAPGENYSFPMAPIVVNVTTPKIFNGGTELYWRVRARARLQIRGVLLRVQPADGVEFTLTGDSFLREADACFTQRGNVAGMTHVTRELKRNVTGTMRFDKDGIVKIDLNVVYANGRVAPGDQSYYAHSSYEIDIRNSPPTAPIDAPVAPPPTIAPVVDRCATSTCPVFFGILTGTVYNRFYGGQCRETCALISLFAPSLFGWRCGTCF